MSSKVTHYKMQLIILLLLFAAGCAPDEPEATEIPVARATVTYTAVLSATASAATRPPSPTPAVIGSPTATATLTAVPTQPPTPITFPLPPIGLFPTVTPDYRVYETKSIFLSIGPFGGDGAGNSTPSFIIYGDGQLLLRDDGRYLETTLTPAEMCAFRQQIEDTGFLAPHTEFFTEQTGSVGAPELVIRVEETFYSFYWPDMPYLLEELAKGVELIQDYRPPGPLTLYVPRFLVLRIQEPSPYDQLEELFWPSELASLSELGFEPDQNSVLIEGEWVVPIFELFSGRSWAKAVQEGDTVYQISPEPLLPDETPYRSSAYASPPRDYVPVLNCEGDPALISPDIPTATPTLTSPGSTLTGQGRIVFVTGLHSNQEIYVIEADGTNRLQLTNNQHSDDEPVWSPDGQQIAFTSGRNGISDIYVMDFDGRNVRQLTENPSYDFSPSWSPDGTKIAFISRRDGSGIYMMNSDGSAEVEVARTDSHERSLVWSPDGQKIAFVKEEEGFGKFQVAVLYLENGLVEDIFAYEDFGPPLITWSPDSLTVAVSSDIPSEADPKIQLVDLDGNETEEYSIHPLQSIAWLDWSADGRYILFVARRPDEAIRYYSYQANHGISDLYVLDLTNQEIIQITFTQDSEYGVSWWP